jgi:hypothetical protein
MPETTDWSGRHGTLRGPAHTHPAANSDPKSPYYSPPLTHNHRRGEHNQVEVAQYQFSTRPNRVGKAIRNITKQIMRGDTPGVVNPDLNRGQYGSHGTEGTEHWHGADKKPYTHSHGPQEHSFKKPMGEQMKKASAESFARSVNPSGHSYQNSPKKDWTKHRHPKGGDSWSYQHGPNSHEHDSKTGKVSTVMGRAAAVSPGHAMKAVKPWEHKPTKDHWHPHNPDTGNDVVHSHPTSSSTQVPGSPPVQASHPYTGTKRRVHPFGKAIQKGLKGPILEEGKKTDGKYTTDAPYAQAFNADNLTKRALRLSYGPVFEGIRSVIKKAGENVPGNLNEHLKRAHAAIHGREMFNPKYKELCQQVAGARKILTALESELQEAEQQKEGMEGMGVPENKAKAWAPGERNAYESRSREIEQENRFGRPKDSAPNLPPHDNLKHWNNAGVDHTHYKGTPSAIRHSHGPTSADRAAATKDQDGALKAAVSSYPAPKKQGEPFDTHMRRIARQNAGMNDVGRSIMGSGDLHEHRGQGSHSHPDAWTAHTHKMMKGNPKLSDLHGPGEHTHSEGNLTHSHETRRHDSMKSDFKRLPYTGPEDKPRTGRFR